MLHFAAKSRSYKTVEMVCRIANELLRVPNHESIFPFKYAIDEGVPNVVHSMEMYYSLLSDVKDGKSRRNSYTAQEQAQSKDHFLSRPTIKQTVAPPSKLLEKESLF